MKWWGLMIFMLFLIFIMGMVLWGAYSLLSKVFISVQQSVPLSPLEDNLHIGNLKGCSDSDGGIFFNVPGKVTYETGVLFFKWRVDISDECRGDELTEYYCGREDSFTKGIVMCEKGCFGGRCVG